MSAEVSFIDAQQALFNYIEVYYNRRRRHSTNGYKPPASYEAEWEKLQNAAKLTFHLRGERSLFKAAYSRGLKIASRISKVKADGLSKPEGSRPGYAMTGMQFTTGVRDQGMHPPGWRGKLGAPFVSLHKSR